MKNAIFYFRVVMISVLLLSLEAQLNAESAAPTVNKVAVTAKESKNQVELTAKLVDGKKMWLPTNITANKGAIHFILKNTFPDPHGFNIPGVLKEPVTVPGSSTIDLNVVIDKPGSYDLMCHLHPAHVKAQLTVK